jgi:3-oxoacyl-[acyl-carrier protein] reductase
MNTTACAKRKWVLVTGGTRGIGKGLVEEFCRANYDVVFSYKQSDEAAKKLESSIGYVSGVASGYCCDSGDEAAVRMFSKNMLAQRGSPYAIVNNVGITRDSVLMRMSTEQWLDVINININSSFFVIRAFIEPMLEQGDGVILQMSSVSGLRGNPGQTNYAASKAALIGMTRTLAVELGRFNIRVNTIAPGYIATDMLADMPENKIKAIKDRIPLRRLGTVKEVASLAVYLASQDSTYITGQTFIIDGGLIA